MIAGEEDLRHGSAVPDGGAAVLRVFQHPREVALVLEALRVCQDPGDHAAHGIGDGHGGDLAAGEDEIPDGYFLVYALIDKPLVNALVVAADQDQVVQLAQADGIRLGEGMAAGGHIDGVDRPSGLVAHRLPAAVDGVRLHDGSPASPVGVVVHLVLLVGGVVPDLVGADMDEPPLLGPAQDTLGEHIPQGIGEQGENINPHRFPCPPAASLPSGCHPGPWTG